MQVGHNLGYQVLALFFRCLLRCCSAITCWCYLLLSHELIATMQSMVTGQAPPITLERKITFGGNHMRNGRKYTQQLKQVVYLRLKYKGGISVRTYLVLRYIIMLNESQRKPKPRKRHYSAKYPQRKRQGGTNDAYGEAPTFSPLEPLLSL